ncbi:DUF1275 family protein [Streptomyces sp. NPDC093064]|uniref:DUF1275 family protein n=1 Tax=Streptomyces sp. NPDC093064 TaxID=3366020 RepID=UPI0038014490
MFVKPGGTSTVTATCTDDVSPVALSQASANLTVPSGWTAQATSPTTFTTVKPGQSVKTRRPSPPIDIAGGPNRRDGPTHKVTTLLVLVVVSRGAAMEPDGETAGGPGLVMRIAVVMLVAASGAVEAISFTALDHVFAGVMTSNLALLGMAIGRARGADVTAALLALAGFGAGAAVVAWVTHGRPGTTMRWSRRVAFCLAGEAVLLAVGAVFWAASGGAPGSTARDVMQCGAALAMGGQAAAMVAAGRAAAPTTYLTGTLATYIVRGLGGASGRPDRWVPLRLVALIAGAAAAMALRWAAPAWAGALPFALVTAATLTASRPRAVRQPPTDDPPVA